MSRSAAGCPATSSAELGVGDEVQYLVGKPEEGLVVELERTVTLTRFPVADALVADLPLALAAALLLSRAGWRSYRAPGPGRPPGLACRHVPAACRHRLRPVGRRRRRPRRRPRVLAARRRRGAVRGGVGARRAGRRHLADPTRMAARPCGGCLRSRCSCRSPGTPCGPSSSAGDHGRPRPHPGAAVGRGPLAVVAVPAVLVALAATYQLAALARGPAGRPAGPARARRRVWRSGCSSATCRRGFAGNPVLPWDVLLLLRDAAGARRRGGRPGRLPARRHRAGRAAHASCRARSPPPRAPSSWWSRARSAARPTSRSASILAGGVVALLVLPLAVALQRGVRRLVYGERDLPRTVVSELRTPRRDHDARPRRSRRPRRCSPRRLRLSYAAIDVPDLDGDEPPFASVGELGRGTGDGRPGGRRRPRSARCISRPAPSATPFGRGDRRLLEDVGAQVGALVQAVLANRELMRSRQRARLRP